MTTHHTTEGSAPNPNQDEENTVPHAVPLPLVAAEDSIQTLKARAQEEEPSVTAQLSRQGAFFAYASVPMMCFSSIAFSLHIMTYLLGLGWNRNAMALILGLYENPVENKAMNHVINIHAFLGLTSVALLVFQVLGALHFSQRALASTQEGAKESWIDTILCEGHKWNGKIVYAFWLTVSIAGATFSLGSEKFGRGEETGLAAYILAISTAFGFIFVGTITNMTVGIISVMRKVNRDMLLHKGCMFFAMNWILSSAFDEVIMAIAQTIVFHCNIGSKGYVICAFAGQTFQIVGFIVAAMWYDAAILKYRFVQANVFFWSLRTLLFGAWCITWLTRGVDTNETMMESDKNFCF